MLFLMHSNKDSKKQQGTCHLDKLWILHPKCKPALCLPYKNLPTFVVVVGCVVLLWKTYLIEPCQSLSAKFSSAHNPWKKVPCVHVRRTGFNEYAWKINFKIPNFCNFWKLVMDVDKHIMYVQHITLYISYINPVILIFSYSLFSLSSMPFAFLAFTTSHKDLHVSKKINCFGD